MEPRVLMELMIKTKLGSVCVGHIDAIVYLRWLSFDMRKGRNARCGTLANHGAKPSNLAWHDM